MHCKVMYCNDVVCPDQAVGVLSSAYTSGWLVDKVGARPVLALMALFPLLMCFTACLIKDRRAGYDELPDGEAAVCRPGWQADALVLEALSRTETLLGCGKLCLTQ